MFGLGSQELLVILVSVLILFGANRLPQLARSLGASMKEFKKGIDEGKGPAGSATTPEDTLKAVSTTLRPCRHYLQGRSSLKRGLEARCSASPPLRAAGRVR